MKSIQVFVLISSFLFFACVHAQEKEVQIKAHQLTDNIYMITGQGGNIGLFIGADGTFMIDDQFAPLTPKILSVIQQITKQPVKYLINTHWHGDHTGGNENMQKEGAIIVSHENVRKRMSVAQFTRGTTKPAAVKSALPVITFTKDMMIHLNGEDILISHVHNAHTDGDVIVYFTKSNVIHMGDTYFQGKFPFIDLESGGSINGYIEAIDKVLLLSDDKTILVPGHRNRSNKKELLSYRNMLTTVRNRIQKAIDKGESEATIKANSNLTSEFNKKYGGWFIKEDVFRATVYKSLLQQ